MLIYRLELKGSSLFVRLEEEGSPRRILYLDSLKAQKDIALQLLVKLHVRANGGRSLDTLSFQEILLPPSSAKEAIRSMIETGRLFFQGVKLSAKKMSVHWKGEKHSAKAATLRAMLDDLPLESVDLLFPGWAICKDLWIEIETNVYWKWVDHFRAGSVLLEGMQKRDFLEEEPKVVWTEKVEETLRVLPQLVLSDGSGCFANLWMEYPGIGSVAFEDFAPEIRGRTRLKKEESAWEKDLVEAGFFRKVVEASRYYCPGEKVHQTLRFLLELGWSCLDTRGRKILLQSGCELKIREENGRIAVEGKIRFGEKEGSIKAAQKSRLFLDLDGAHVGLLEGKQVPVLEGLWEGEIMTIPKRKLGEVVPLLEREGVDWEASLKKAVTALKNGEGIASCSLDQSFQGKLLPYQQKGVEWLFFLEKWGFGALLSDEMGLGKTVQAVAFFSQLRTNLPILIVAPTSLLFNWHYELSRFWPEAKVYLHSGPDRQLKPSQVILTSYAILRIEAELLSKWEFGAVLLDESQTIKSSASQVSQAACRLKAPFKIAMSGTPIENRPEELWSQFRFLMPDLLGEKSEFLASSIESVRRKIKPFVLCRRKEDVQIELPEKIDQPVWVDFTESQEALYDQTLSAFKSGLLKKVRAEGIAAHRMEVLEVILRLRQICADPRLLGGLERGSKAEMLLTAAEELAAQGKKALVFSQFTTFLRTLEKDLRALGIEPLYLDGSTPEAERGKIVRQFQEEEKPHLFLLSLKAGGVGLNLTAAETVILLDPWWNDAVERQAIDRAHRIGQKKTLLVHRYLTPHSIEEKMLKIKNAKAESASALLGGEECGHFTEEDLLHLLS